MKRSHSLGLIATGNLSDSFLPQFPTLADRLGPVRSATLRQASRICGILDAGEPVDSWDKFARTSTVLLHVGETELGPLTDSLIAAPFSWRNKTVLLCDSTLDSDALKKLAFLGAATGSLAPLRHFEGRLVVLEGDRKAVKEARDLVEHPETKVIEIDRGKRALFAAGVSFSSSLVLPLLVASTESLRACGLSQQDALFVADRMFQRTLRNFVRSGRKGWTGDLPSEDSEALRRQMYALVERSPQLANYFYENSVHALQLFRRDPEWLKQTQATAVAKAAG